MATVRDIYNFIDSIAPFDTQEDWDNSGFLVGDDTKEVNKALFALDITSDIINQAVNEGADLIITHHPAIFKPLTEVTSDSFAYKLIKNNISIISAHTNYDKASEGVNDILCYTIGLDSFSKVPETCLNIGYYKEKINITDFVNNIKNSLGGVVRYNDTVNAIKKIAVCSGSGSDYLNLAHKMGCDVLLTGDGGHHAFLDAEEYGMSLVCAGHFETEVLAISPLMEKIYNKFKIECIVASQNTPIITV